MKWAIHCNAQMTERMLHEFAEPDAASLDMLRMAMERLFFQTKLLQVDNDAHPSASHHQHTAFVHARRSWGKCLSG